MSNSTSNDNNSNWSYNPSTGAAYLFTVLWGLTSLFHLVQMIQFRKWYCWVLTMGCTWEFFGFVTRILAIKHPTENKYYAPSLALIVLAPIWIAAFDYMSLGRLILLFLPSKRCLGLSARKVALIFVAGDITSFMVQLAGTGFLIGNNPSPHDYHIGTSLLISGQAMQLFLFGIFMILAARFEADYKREFGGIGRERWVPFMRILNLSCACIVLRSIFRVAEFASTYPGPLVTHEAPFYLMDELPMIVTAVAFHFVHPGQTLVGEESSFRAQKKKQQAQAEDGDVMVLEGVERA
ncbi:RTA1 like protein-domain-containing protein [Sphaerosporella brunnea]|uniref:RTA1 like protein-domain-containing protein n=1 Tax=Sphaerosporella brunnea TaxID=1250544 RepID=A0A5J5F348_9PEZI|nr:RTA1 like protein-domain-containing protein [Sphaerosporella brunnea]